VKAIGRRSRWAPLGLLGLLVALAAFGCATPPLPGAPSSLGGATPAASPVAQESGGAGAGTTSSPAASPGASPATSAAPSAPVASPSPVPSVTPHPSPLPPAAIPLTPASPGANPVDLLAWLFTPIFWALFNVLVIFDRATGNIAVAIVALTLLIRALLIPVFRSQLVSQRRLQMVQPELRELLRHYKGDRAKQMEVQQRFYQERGINPASGCLPALIQFGLLIPMYTVISQGLQNFNPQAMTPIPLHCDPAPVIDNGHVTNPCLNPMAFGIDWSRPEILAPAPLIGGISGLAIVAALLQLFASRMTLPPPSEGKSDDPATRAQRQTYLFLPLITIVYGGILPAGLFLYWIVTTIFSIVQQYLIVGWGGMFPIFGWYPEFARNHTPRFPVTVPVPTPARGTATGPSTAPLPRRSDPAATIRPRPRSGRRGRRR
jgi:YidC/Oxa1 family membrane protein insertase